MVKKMPKKYYTRIIENELDQMLGIFGAVLIEGPKWCGKTTTAGTRAASRLLLMDPSRNFENRLRAETDPALAVSGEVPRLIDEWQEVPKLWDAARFECDNRGGEPGQFIFTGSATPRDNERPMHSGAGRFAKLRMDTMTLFELGKSSGAVKLSSIISGEKFNGAFGSLDSASIAKRVHDTSVPCTVLKQGRAYVAIVPVDPGYRTMGKYACNQYTRVLRRLFTFCRNAHDHRITFVLRRRNEDYVAIAPLDPPDTED